MSKSLLTQLNDRDWLFDQYVTQERTATDIAKDVGCHYTAVTRALKRHGIEVKRHAPPPPVVQYPQLGDRDWLIHQVQVLMKPLRQIAEEVGCSYSAVVYAVRSHGIEVPGKVTRRLSPTRSENVKKALRERYPEGRTGAQASNWRGGRAHNADGYVLVYAPDHPRAGRHNRIFEHILVAEKQLGRYLKPGEIVHHINHVKDDNRPENLRVTVRGAHVSDHFAEGKRAAAAELENAQLKLENERLKLENERLRALLRAHNIPTEEDE